MPVGSASLNPLVPAEAGIPDFSNDDGVLRSRIPAFAGMSGGQRVYSWTAPRPIARQLQCKGPKAHAEPQNTG
jgi:hypothetical protein